MKQEPIKKFLNGLLDSDSAEHQVPPNCFISGQQFRFGTTDKGQSGYFESILKNAEKAHSLPAGINIRIGFAADDENGNIVKFNFNSSGDHGIYLYNIDTNLWYTVLLDADVSGGRLNFDKYHLINGAFIINNILYWNDNFNEPRKLQLGAFIAGYVVSPTVSPIDADYTITYPVDETEITLIRRPCAYPPTILKSYDSGFNNNFISNSSYQFAIEFVHFDGERAVLSGWSKASLLNKSTEVYNYIHIVLNNTDTIPQTVRIVRIVVKRDIDEAFKGNVVKEWDRLVTSENTLINNQNLSFDYYGNISGEQIDDVTMVRPFHSVPLLSGSQAQAKNRNILVDNLEGYDPPGSTSIDLYLPNPISMGFTGLTKTLISFKHRCVNSIFSSLRYAYSSWYVYLAEVVPQGWYEITSTAQVVTGNSTYPVLPANPSPITFAALTFRGADAQTVVANTRPPTRTLTTEVLIDFFTGQSCIITGISTLTYGVCAPDAMFKGGVMFYDRYLRKCSVAYSNEVIQIPSRNFLFSTAYSAINWALGNSNAQSEIPDWAYYYAPLITDNLRTRYFIASFDNAAKYATKNATTGLLEFTALTFGINVVALAINTKGLLQANLGWAVAEGDMCVLIDNLNNRYELPVIGSEGDYFLLKATDVGSLSGKTFVYRLYIPYKSSEQEPFFERGDIFPITDPTLSTRTYSTILGTFRSDSFAMTRTYASTTYYAEAMCPNDVFFQRRDTDNGRPNFITKLGQVRKPTGISFSSVYIQGTSTNGLSEFDALNKQILPEDFGTLKKAILAAKVQKEGSVLLVIGTQEAASIYLGEVQVTDTEGNVFFTKSDKFIGQINPLKGGFGTSNHESVTEFGGEVAWFSSVQASFVRYANNGIFPISDNGLKRVAKLFSDKYISLTVAQIEALGSRPFVFGGIDPYHGEWYWSIPATEDTPPKGFLEDYTTSGSKILYDVRQTYNYTPALDGPSIVRYYYGMYVLLTDASPAGYYAIASTETNQNSTPPAAAVPPTTIAFTDLVFRGATLTDIIQSTIQGAYSENTASSITNTGYSATVTGIMSFPYPYDVYDGRAKVLVYKMSLDKWGAPHPYQTEGFITIRNSIYSAKEGKLYKHNVDDGTANTYNQWYGTAVKSCFGFLINEQANIIKDFLTLSVEGNLQPTFLHSRTLLPNIQSTDLVAEWKTRQGIFYCALRRDRLSPNSTGTFDEKLLKGDKMVGQWLYVWVEFDTQTLLQVRYFNAGFEIALGGNT